MAAPVLPETSRAALTGRNNIIAIAAVGALSAALLNPVPIIVFLAAEISYIVYVVYRHGSIRILESDRTNKNEQETQNKKVVLNVSASALQRVPDTKAIDKNESSSVNMRETARPFPSRGKEKIAANIPSLMELPVHGKEEWEELSEIERAFRSVENKVSPGAPKTKELLDKLESLMDTYEFFILKEQELSDTVYFLYQEAKNIREHLTIKMVSTAAPLGRKLGFSAAGASASEIAANIERAHEYYDKELEEISWNTYIEDSVTRVGLEQRKQSLLGRKRKIDQVGKVLTSIHFTLNLLVKKFKQIDTELESSSPYDIIVEVDLLIDRTNVVMRLIEEVQIVELSFIESVA